MNDSMNNFDDVPEVPKKQYDFYRGLKDFIEPCLLPLGFKETDGLAGVNYIWEENGRTIKFHTSRRRKTKYAGEIRYTQYAGHQIEFTASTPVKTRLNLAVVQGTLMKMVSASNRFFKMTQLMDQPSYEHLHIWVAEPAWAERFLENTAVKNAVSTLIPAQNAHSSVGLRFWPSNVTYTLRTNLADVTPELVEGWFNALQTILDTAESNPPMDEVQPTWMERQSQKTIVFVWVALLLGVPFFSLFCCMITALLFIFATGNLTG